jgi:hypothetical protein
MIVNFVAGFRNINAIGNLFDAQGEREGRTSSAYRKFGDIDHVTVKKLSSKIHSTGEISSARTFEALSRGAIKVVEWILQFTPQF